MKQSLNRPVTSKEINLVIKNPPQWKIQTRGFTVEFYQNVQRESAPALSNSSQNLRRGTLNSFSEVSTTLITKARKRHYMKNTNQYLWWKNWCKKFKQNTNREFSDTLEGLYTMTEWDLLVECSDGSTYENQSVYTVVQYTTWMEWRGKIPSQTIEKNHVTRFNTTSCKSI